MDLEIKMEENLYDKVCVICHNTFTSKGKEQAGICDKCQNMINKSDYEVKVMGNWVTTQNEYFRIIKELCKNRKTPIYYIETHEGIPLGKIKWYGAWRKFCFFPNEQTIWDSKCLKHIIEFLDETNKEWRERK